MTVERVVAAGTPTPAHQLAFGSAPWPRVGEHVEKGKKMKTTAPNLIRWDGLSAVAGGSFHTHPANPST